MSAKRETSYLRLVKRQEEERLSAARERPRNLLAAASAWLSLICAAVATGCGLWIRFGSVRIDPLIPWVAGLLALSCLIVNRVASRRRSRPQSFEEDERRLAA